MASTAAGHTAPIGLPVGKDGRALWLFITALFAFSGLSSLMYQVLWMRQLEFLFGATILATSTVLAIFMGGLALGAFLAAQYVDRIRNQFLWYGILEGIIGLWALLAPIMFSSFTPIYQYSWQHWHVSPLMFNLIRVISAAIVLLPPTACMGATLPLLSRFITSSLENVGDRVGSLYSVNTIGAVVGTAVAGFILLPEIGTQATTFVAATINFFLCAAVFAWHKLCGNSFEATGLAAAPDVGASSEQSQLSPTPNSESIAASAWKVRTAIILFGVSGAFTMIYEVAWTRALLMIIGSTTYTFSIMLASFLIGIVIGSFICSKIIDRQKDAFAVLALLEMGAALATFLAMWCFARLPYWNIQLNYMFLNFDGASNIIRLALSGLILMPLTMCLGALFPAVIKACTCTLQKVGNTVGTVYASNTIGAIGGALLGGFLLIPSFGGEFTLILCGLGNLAIGVIILAMAPSIRTDFKMSAAVALILCLVSLPNMPEIWDRKATTWAQPLRRHMLRDKTAGLDKNYEDFIAGINEAVELLFYKEGLGSNVAILRSRGNVVSLVTNGHVDASNSGDMEVQQVLGYLPMVAHPDPKTVAIVGWGSGVTTGTTEQFKSPTSIKTIELEPVVVESSTWFNAVNHGALKDKRLSIEQNDGRNYLLATDEKYDVIISEPSNPWQVGVCNLFTKEYFDIVRQRLASHGIFSLWLQTFEVGPKNIREVLAAIHSVFPYTLTFVGGQANLVVLCSETPITIDYARVAQMAAEDQAKTRDKRLKSITTAEQLLSHLALTNDGLTKLVQGATPNSDDRNKLQYDIAKTYETKNFYLENSSMLATNMGDPYLQINWGKMDAGTISDTMAKIAEEAIQVSPQVAGNWLSSAAAHSKKTPELYRVAGLVHLATVKAEQAQRDWQTGLELSPDNRSLLLTRASYYTVAQQRDKAIADYQTILKRNPQDKRVRVELAQMYAPTLTGATSNLADVDAPSILKYLGDLPNDQEFVKSTPMVLLLAAEANYKLARLAEAQKLVDRYLAIVPKSVPATRLAGTLKAAQGNRLAAAYWWHKSFALASQHDGAVKCLEQAGAFVRNNQTDAAVDQLRLAIEFDPGYEKPRMALQTLVPQNKKAAELLRELNELGPVNEL